MKYRYYYTFAIYMICIHFLLGTEYGDLVFVQAKETSLSSPSSSLTASDDLNHTETALEAIKELQKILSSLIKQYQQDIYTARPAFLDRCRLYLIELTDVLKFNLEVLKGGDQVEEILINQDLEAYLNELPDANKKQKARLKIVPHLRKNLQRIYQEMSLIRQATQISDLQFLKQNMAFLNPDPRQREMILKAIEKIKLALISEKELVKRAKNMRFKIEDPGFQQWIQKNIPKLSILSLRYDYSSVPLM